MKKLFFHQTVFWLSVIFLGMQWSLNAAVTSRIFHVSQTEREQMNYFPSIQEAYDYAVSHYQRGKEESPAVILVHQGDYVLKKSLHFYADVPAHTVFRF